MTIKLNLGKPKTPTKPLADQLKTEKGAHGQSSLSINPLRNTIAKLDTPEKQITSTNIPSVSTEKYSLLAEASDTLSQDTITQFNQRMNYVIEAMGNPELPDAMKRVLEYTQKHNELRPWLREEDIAVFVRGARLDYARIAAKKDKNRSKKSKSAKLDNAVMESLGDIEIDL